MISGIVATDKKHGIGLNNKMPWPHLNGDMSFFKTKTVNNVVIMGSTTYKSIGKPLPNRINIVLSKTKNYSGHGQSDHTFSDPNTALTFSQIEYPDKEIFIIGGSEIYKIFLPIIDTFYITEINHDYQCDRFFDLDFIKNNCKSNIELLKYNDPIEYTITKYTL
jgi:dihydrofolate reductase